MSYHPIIRSRLQSRLKSEVRSIVQAAPRRTVISATSLAENSLTDNVDSYPFVEEATPDANTLLLMAVGCAHAAAAEVPNSISAYGLTWTQVPGTANGTVTFHSNAKRLSFFYAWGSAPVTGAVTLGFATAHTFCIYSVAQISGARLAAPRQSTSNTANSTTVTGTLLSMEYAKNMHIYAVLHITAEAHSPPASGGWTELSDRSVTTPAGGMQLAWTVSGDLTADPTWATSSIGGILCLEVQSL